jgi:hypothetical protein
MQDPAQYQIDGGRLALDPEKCFVIKVRLCNFIWKGRERVRLGSMRMLPK